MKIVLQFLILAFFVTGSVYSQKREDTNFDAFLATVDAGQVELQNGKADAFKAIWSQRDDITLSGGFGGAVEKGWAAVSKRLDWVGANFAKGQNSIERVVANHEGKLGYVVQLEHISFTAPESRKAATRDYRVTMIFRREKDGWRIVHRHADSQMTKQAPQ